jgi:glycosyltransferase involved in cell wall biosynthesis
MRILFFNYEYPPLGGGAANATLCILKEFSKNPDLEVDLVTSSISDKYELETIGANIRIHRLPIGKNAQNLHFQSQKDLLVYAWKSYFFGKKLINQRKKEELRYDLTHSFFSVPCGFVSWLLKRKYHLPYIVSLRGSDVPGYSDRFKFVYSILTPLIKLIWREAAAVIANSQGLRELARESNNQQRVDIIVNGIDTVDFAPNEILRRRDKFIITPGATRITERKGIRYLIEAVGILVPKYPHIFLRVMGYGNAKMSLIELVEEKNLVKYVQFVGRIPREETIPYYQEAGVFVLPSFNEGMSNAMLEALAVGLPIIATETGGTSELVTDGVNGFVVMMRNAQDLADKIEKIMMDEKLAQKMGQESRARAEKQSWQEVAQQYALLYRNVIEAKK